MTRLVGAEVFKLRSTRTFYGLVIGAKVLGLLVLIAFGAYHRNRVVPYLSGASSARTSSFLTSLRFELIVLWLVVLLGGLLGYISPPQPSPAASKATQSSSSVSNASRGPTLIS